MSKLLLAWLFVVSCSAALVFPASSAWAGGLYINEFTSPSMGVAGAGAEAVANDASTSLHNPAGMTRLDGNEVMLGVGMLSANVEFKADSTTPQSGGNGGDAGGWGPLIGTFGVYSVSEDLKLGMNIFSISGAVLEYDSDWTGRYQAQEVEILTVSLNPTIAYRVNDTLSLGAGLVAMYASLDLTLAVPPGGTGQATLDGDDLSLGFNLGAMVELSPRTRLGLLYFSEQKLEFSGDLDIKPISLSVASDTELILAQLVRIGGYHELNDQWALLGTVGWEDWSAVENLLVSTAATPTVQIPRNWDDTYHLSVGVHYRPVKDWLWQTGFTYDSSPVDEGDRTADMPIDEQFRYAAGVQYQWNEGLNIGASIVYADLGDARINNSNLLIGEYDKNEIIFFALNFNWKL
jgi:long-chain fatty acid transport protein